MTQVEAARVLRCGEATVRRRLVAARERLRARLANTGEVEVMLALARRSTTSSMPFAWANRTPTAAAELLAWKVGGGRIALGLMRGALALGGIGLVTAAVAGWIWQREPAPLDRPRPIAQLPAPAPAPAAPPVRWVHLTSDTGGEVWANLDDGREFRKSDRTISLLQTAAHDLYTYDGNGKVVRTKSHTYVDMVDKAGRPVPPAVFDLAGEHQHTVPHQAPAEERATAQVFQDYAFEDLNGRPCLRIDQFVRDALGEARIEAQVWYDRATDRPVRSRDRLQVADQHKYHRDYATTVWDYPATGPADLAALGVPRETPVVDGQQNQPSWHWADLPTEVRRALTAQSAAVRRFPRDYRAVTADFAGTLRLEYWSAPQEFVDLWCDTRTGDAQFDLDDKQPRHFQGDNQDRTNRPEDLKRAIAGTSNDDLPVDRIVAWFPLDHAVNISLVDGKRTYNLTRLWQGNDKPRRTEVHVLGGGFDSFPKLVEEQWPLLTWNRRWLTPALPDADTPARMIVIRVHQPEPEFRGVFTLDPDHDFIAVRQVVWSRGGDRWHWSDKRAARFAQLPGGSWYVAAWEEQTRFGGSPDQPEARDAKPPHTQRIAIDVLKPAEFPAGIFDGDRFLEDARKTGAVIEVDQ